MKLHRDIYIYIYIYNKKQGGGDNRSNLKKWCKRIERRNKDLERKRKTKKDMVFINKERESSSGSLVEEDVG